MSDTSTGSYSPRLVLKPGQTYWAYCTIREPILHAVVEWDFGGMSSAMSNTMRHDKSWIDKCIQYRRFSELGKPRPCVVLSDQGRAGSVQIIALATFGNRSIAEVDEYTQHFAVSVGNTPPWPPSETATVQMVPTWPYDRCYAMCKAFEVESVRILREFHGGQYKLSSIRDLKFLLARKQWEMANKKQEVLLQHTRSYNLASRQEKAQRKQAKEARLSGVHSLLGANSTRTLDTIYELGAGDPFAESWIKEHAHSDDGSDARSVASDASEPLDQDVRPTVAIGARQDINIPMTGAAVPSTSVLPREETKRKPRLGRRERAAAKGFVVQKGFQAATVI